MKERKLVVTFLLGTALIVVADKAFRGKTAKEVLPPRVLVGLAVAYLFIGFAVEFAPRLAATFAGLIFVGTVLAQGPFVFDKVTVALNRKGTP